MAVNTQKLLPSAKTSAISRVNTSKIVPASRIKKGSIDVAKLTALSQQRSEKNVSIIQGSLVNVNSLLKSVLTEDQQTERTKRIRKEQEKTEERETSLETPKESKKFNLPKVSIPGTSFLDRIKRFLFFTALGWLFTRFQDQLPKLLGIVKIITPIYGVVETVFKFILETVVSFIDRGYETYDKLRGLVKSVGGEKAQEDFDKLSGKLNEYINYVLIGGMALTGAINTFAKNARNYRPPTPPGQRPTVPGQRPPRGPLQRIVRPAQAAAIKASRAIAGKQATRQLLRLAKGTLSKIPLIGGLIEFGLSWALGDPVGKAAFRGIGTLLLGAVGTAIGGPIGAAVLGFAGAELAGKLYDILFENKKPGETVQTQRYGGKVLKRYAKGGQVLGSGGRTLTIQKSKKPYVAPQASQPGKDVGGRKKIQLLYQSPDSAEFFEKKLTLDEWLKTNSGGTYQDYLKEYEKRKKKPNAYRALTEVARILKDIPYGIGGLMGGAVDIALGQKLSRSSIQNISYGLQNLFDVFQSISNNASQALASVQGQIPTMQTGGAVPRTAGMGSGGEEPDLMKIIGKTIIQRVDEALREVQKQVTLAQEEKDKKDNKLPGDGLTPGGGTPEPNLRSGNNAEIEADLLEYFTGLYGKNAAIGIVANLKRESGYRTRTPDNDTYEGIAQWDRKDRWPRFEKWAKSKKLDPYTRNAQAQYIAVELKQLGTDKRLKAAKTPEEAASIFYNEFERGSESKPVKGNKYDPNNKHENINKANVKDISKSNPKIGERFSEVVVPEKPTTPKTLYTMPDASKPGAEGAPGGPKIGEVIGRQGGGYIPRQSSRRDMSRLRMYPSYSDSGMVIAVQPIIIEKPMPMPMPMGGSKTTTFIAAGGGGVNNTMQSLSRG